MRTLAEWLALQELVHERSIDLGLERVASVAQRLGLERPACPTILVGGTNGKGSTVAYLEALLRALGRRVGAFSSPHLVRYNERIRIAGAMASDAVLIAAFERIEAARGATTLTFFEYNTLAALQVFASAGVDVAVLEVGLGGRLDATNLIDADVAVLTSVGLDHRDWLGETLEQIGTEKAGIVRAARPVVLATPAMPRSVFAAIARVGALAWVPGRQFSVRRGTGARHERWSFTAPGVSLDDLPPPALAGEVQYENAAAALAALAALGVAGKLTRELAGSALQSVRLPGRFQILPGEVEWIFDVAHNEPAAQILAANLAQRPPARRSIAVAGFLRDKDVAAISAALAGSFDTWLLCTLPGARGLDASDAQSRLDGRCRNVQRAASVLAGCDMARAQARAGDRVVVFGSFHTVGPALEALGLY